MSPRERKEPAPSRNAHATQRISPSLIDDPQHALRVEMDDAKLAELERDIRENGLYYPLIVEPVGDRFEVVDGHRRLVACRNIGLDLVPCIVRAADSPPPEAVKLKCNLLREDNTDAEIAIWLGELSEKHGTSLEDLCKLVGRSESWVNARVDLLRGDQSVLIALGERKINFSQATVLNRCKDDRWRTMGLHFAISDHVPAAKLQEWLVRNVPTVEGSSNTATVETPPAVDGAPVGPGIVCEFCGGWKDPQNMVNVWLHRWEWAMVQQMLSMRQQEIAAAAGDEQVSQ
jgi:ParB/RepB/Spo0J family partition protein